MDGLAPANENGEYQRPESKHKNAKLPKRISIENGKEENLPRLIIGRSCPWAHRTWLVYELRSLNEKLVLIKANVDTSAGLWKLNPKWLECESLLELYKKCQSKPNLRATVPVIIDPTGTNNSNPEILGNESSQLIDLLNIWPTDKHSVNLSPLELKDEIFYWKHFLQESVNNGVYKCGFARNQRSYEKASNTLFESLKKIDIHLSKKGPWLCGEKLTIADVCLFPTLIRWEMIYSPLFNCGKIPLWFFENIWEWRKRFYNLPRVSSTCDSLEWRKDYFGALFPLRPNGIIPSGPSLSKLVNAQTKTIR